MGSGTSNTQKWRSLGDGLIRLCFVARKFAARPNPTPHIPKGGGATRAEHFDGLLRMSPGEVGLGVDNDACFVVEGDSWRGTLHAA